MQEKAVKGDWVKIYKIVLNPNERAPQIPSDTSQVPLELRLNGFLNMESAKIGDEVEILTPSERKETGKLVEINPFYTHSFGKIIPELNDIGYEARKMIEKDDL